MSYRVEALMSARLFLFPQHAGGRLYFISNLSGHLSLYAMNLGGSVPVPLLPPNLAMQNPDLVDGYSYCVFPKLGKILVSLDKDGDENYQPMLIPADGGFPEPTFDNYFARHRVHVADCDKKRNIIYLVAERRDVSLMESYRGDLKTGKLTKLAESPWGMIPVAHNAGHDQVLLIEPYEVGDSTLYLQKGDQRRVLYGRPRGDRAEGEDVPLSGLSTAKFAPSGKAAVTVNAVFEDSYSLGYVRFSKPGVMMPVKVRGLAHRGLGELTGLEHLVDDV
ncbi:MAG TPA: S9 family peptidase, partial [Bacteroidota bacterium]